MTKSLEGLKTKLCKYGALKIVKQGVVFTVMLTGQNLSKWETVHKLQELILEYAGEQYPLIEAMVNDETFFCLILKPNHNPMATDDGKKIEDYLHLYLGCKVKQGNELILRDLTPDLLHVIKDFGYYNKIKLILRPLSAMTNGEAKYFAWLCMDSEYHLKKDERISIDDVDVEVHFLVVNDVELYIGVTCICFEGGITFRKDGSITLCDDTNKEHRIDKLAEKIRWLLSKWFDLFGLIEAGLAIDATTLK